MATLILPAVITMLTVPLVTALCRGYPATDTEHNYQNNQYPFHNRFYI